MAKKAVRHVKKAHTLHRVKAAKGQEQNMFIYVVMYGLAALLLLITAMVVNSRREMATQQNTGVLGVHTQQSAK